MNLSYYLFGIKATVTGTPAVALPAVSVAETHTYNSADNSMSVTWKLLFSKPLTGSVNVRHTNPATGELGEWPWGVEGESWQGSYTYDLDNMQGLGSLVFEVLPGTGYTIGSPASVSIDVSAYTGGGTTNPPPPLGSGDAVEFMIEDTQMQTLWFMPPPGACSVDCEYQIGTGAVTSCSGNILDLGGLTFGIGGFRIRKKALGGNPAGAWVYNKRAFSPASIVWEGPITVNSGGTISGRNFKSTVLSTPCAKVGNTSDLVVFEYCNFEGLGIMVDHSTGGAYDSVNNHGMGARMIVRNCRMNGLDIPNGTVLHGDGKVAVRVLEPVSVTIENNFIRGMREFQLSGSYRGNGTPSETVTVRYNRAVNIDSRLVMDGSQRQGGNFFGYFNMHGTEIPHMVVDWNHFHNHFGKHDMEDGLSLSHARGTAASPIQVRNDCFRGSSYWRYQTHNDPNYAGGFYSGVLIMLESIGYPTNAAECTNNVNLDGNYLFDGGNGHMSCCSALNAKYKNNTIVSKGFCDKEDLTPEAVDGGELKGSTGVSTYDDQYYYLQDATGVEFDSNRRAVAQDWSISENKDTSTSAGRIEAHFPGLVTANTSTQVQETNPIFLEQGVPITEDTVNKYEREWWAKVAANGLTIGPVPLSQDVAA